MPSVMSRTPSALHPPQGQSLPFSTTVTSNSLVNKVHLFSRVIVQLFQKGQRFVTHVAKGCLVRWCDSFQAVKDLEGGFAKLMMFLSQGTNPPAQLGTEIDNSVHVAIALF